MSQLRALSRVLLRSDRGAVSFFTAAGSTLMVPHSFSQLLWRQKEAF